MFCIEAGDAGSEAYRNEYVHWLEKSVRAFPAIWLRKENGRFIVAVEVGKRWVDVIEEVDGDGGGMSHIVEPAGIQARIDGDKGVTA
jgi:hypothetical protein